MDSSSVPPTPVGSVMAGKVTADQVTANKAAERRRSPRPRAASRAAISLLPPHAPGKPKGKEQGRSKRSPTAGGRRRQEWQAGSRSGATPDYFAPARDREGDTS